MEKIRKEVLHIYDHIKKIERTQKQEKQFKELVNQKKKKKINFEDFAKGVIRIHSTDLVYKKRNARNKEILRYFSNLLVFVNEDRWKSGKYQQELEPISKSISREEKRHGLKEGEFFPLDNSPKEIQKLNKKYNQVLREKEEDVFEEFLSDEIREFFAQELNALKKERENDLKNIKQKIKKKKKDQKTPKETKLLNYYYREFRLCYKNKIYLSAVLMLGAAFESLLISILKEKKDLQQEIDTLFASKIVNSKDLYKMTLADLIKLSSKVGLMPNVEYREKVLILPQMSETLKSARNLVHPGKILKETDFIFPHIGKEDVDLLHCIFKMIKKINT